MLRPLALSLIMLATPTLACEPVSVGPITITGAWSRASVGIDRPGVVYMTIRNAGEADDALTGIATPAAEMPMLHETVMVDGVASMPHLMAVPVPAGQTVALEPGGMHGMLMGLVAPLAKGDSFPVTLTFQQAGVVTVPVAVLALGASGPDCPAP